MRILRLRKAQIELRQSKLEYDRAVLGKDAGIVSAVDLERTQAAHAKAQLEFQTAVASLAGSTGRFVVRSATKARDERGKIRVTVTLELVSDDGTAELGVDGEGAGLDPEWFRRVRNVSVSLRAEGVVVGEPYQVEFPVVSRGERKRAEFSLLKDVDVVEVSVVYRDKQESTKVLLVKDARGGAVVVTSATPSQEVDLGQPGTFDLAVERFGKEASAFRLAVAGLPPDIAHEFLDPASTARLMQVTFLEGVTSARLGLKLYLPREESAVVRVDQAIPFEVVLTEEGGAPASSEHGASRGGRLGLKVVPRGVGRIDIDVTGLYQEVRTGDPVEYRVTVRNRGTRPLENVRIETDVPLEWSKRIEPEVLPVVKQATDETVVIRIVPPADVSVGDYEARFTPSCTVFGRRLVGEERIGRIHMGSRGGWLKLLVLLGAVAAVLGTMIVVSIRLARQ